MFEVDRTYYVNNGKTGKIEWYFQAREGNSGPYESKQEAQLMLQEFIKENIEYGNTGGRNSKEDRPTSKAQVTFKFRPKNLWY